MSPNTPVIKKINGSNLYDSEVWITDRAWISGIAGLLTMYACVYWIYATDALSRGLFLGSFKIGSGSISLGIFTLVSTAGAMCIVELIRLFLSAPTSFISISPYIKERKIKQLLVLSLWVFIKNICLLWLCIKIYGYFPIFEALRIVLDAAWYIYLWLGFFYVFLTLAFKHDPQADQLDYSHLIEKLCLFLISTIPNYAKLRPNFGENEKKIILGLLIKLFFAHVMTVFYFNHFQNLVSNIGYLIDVLPEKITSGSYSHATFNQDLFNIFRTLLFSADIALAWCGYIVTSRWLNNQTQSAEPTLLGWTMCLVSYPPFYIITLFFIYPSDSEIFVTNELWLTTLFTFFSILTICIYTSATIMFGVRFSNLTHRGVIRKGPFAIVRHPAYSSKNISWWCIMLPAVLINTDRFGYSITIALICGLTVQSYVYYLRALTEERHLSRDPKYLEYCKRVRYRFIPGVV